MADAGDGDDATAAAPTSSYYDFATGTTWHVLYDEAAGYQYYWNAESGESTFERSVGWGFAAPATSPAQSPCLRPEPVVCMGLSETEGSCVLVRGPGTRSLSPAPPCYFLSERLSPCPDP